MCTVHCRKSTFTVTVHWTVTAILQNKTREKKKNKNPAIYNKRRRKRG